MAKPSEYRRAANRCAARLLAPRESGKIDSWRCQLVSGHAGRHESLSGHRAWEGGQVTLRPRPVKRPLVPQLSFDQVDVREHDDATAAAVYGDELLVALALTSEVPIEQIYDTETLKQSLATAENVVERIRDAMDK